MADQKDTYTLEALLTGNNSRLKKVVDQAVMMLERLENRKSDDVKIDGDVKPLQKKVEMARRLSESLDGQNAEIDIDADTSKLSSKVKQAEMTADLLDKKKAQIEIIARNSEAIRSLQRVRLSAKQLSSEKPKVDIDVEEAAAVSRIARFKAVLKSIPNKVRVRLDADPSAVDRLTQRAGLFQKAFRSASNSVKDGFGETASEISMMQNALMALAPAAIPIVASLVPAIMAVGNAIAVVGGGAIGLAGAFGIAGAGALAFGGMAMSAYQMLQAGTLQATAETVAFQTALSSLKTEWAGLVQSNQASIFTAMANGINIAKAALTSLTPFISQTASSIAAASGKMLSWVTNSTTAQNAFKMLNTTGVQVFNDILAAVGRFGAGFVSLITQFGPLFQFVSSGLAEMGADFQAWSNKVSTAQGIQSFISYVQTNLPVIGSIFGNVFTGIFNLFTAFGTNSQTIFGALEQMSAKFAAWSATIAQSQGFKQFIDYVQTQGPIVMSTIGSIVTAVIAFATAMAPVGAVVLQVVAAVAQWVAGFAQAHPQITMVAGAIMSFIGFVGMITPIIMNVVNGIMVMVRIFNVVRTVIQLAGAAFALLTSPIGLVVLAIGLVVAAIAICYQKFEGFRNFLQPLVQVFTDIGTALKEGLGGAISWIGEKIGAIAGPVSDAFSGMANSASTHTSQMAAVTQANTGIMSNSALTNSGLMASGFGSNLSAMVGTNSSGWSSMSSTAQTLSGAMNTGATGNVTQMTAGMKNALQGLGVDTESTFSGMSSTGIGETSNLNSGVLGNISGMSGTGVGEVSGMASGINSEFQNMSNTATSATGNMSASVKTNLNSMNSSFVSGANGISNAWSSAMQRIITITSSGMSSVRSSAISGMAAMVAAFTSGGQQAVSVTISSMAACANAMRSAYGQFSAAGGYAMSGFAAGMQSQSGYVQSVAAGIANQAAATIRAALKIHSPSRVTMESGKWFGQGLAIGIIRQVPKVAKASTKMAKAAIKSLNKMKTNSYKKAGEGSAKFYETLKKASGTAAKKIATNNEKIAKIQQKLRGKVWKSTRAKLNKQLIDLRKENQAYSYQRNTIDSLRKSLRSSTNQLAAIAKKRESIATRLKGAQARLTEIYKDRTAFKADILQNTRSFGSISNAKVSTSQGLVAEMKARAKAIAQFSANINKLKKRGVNQTTIQQLLSAGVEGGGAQARILANASKGTIKQINTLQKQIGNVTHNLAERQARDFFTVGVNMARGLVNGLKKQDKALVAAANRIANTITGTVKRNLGIHSPSRVFAGLGGHTVGGYIVGVLDKQRAAVRVMSGLATKVSDAFTPRFTGMPTIADSVRKATSNIATQVNADVVNTVRDEPVGVTLNANFALGNRDYNAFVGDITDKQNTSVRLEEVYDV